MVSDKEVMKRMAHLYKAIFLRLTFNEQTGMYEVWPINTEKEISFKLHLDFDSPWFQHRDLEEMQRYYVNEALPGYLEQMWQ